MTDISKRLNTKFNDLVPRYGKADTVAGEIVRALTTIVYRWYDAGDMIGVDYGNYTCNAPARYLMDKLPCELSPLFDDLWQNYVGHSDEYEKALNTAAGRVLDWLESTDLMTKPNNENMLDWYKSEDCDVYDEEEEYY